MDRMKITIKKDGTVKTTTDQISGTNHVSAEQLLGALARLQGGATTDEQRQTHSHNVEGVHEHQHDVDHQH